MKIGFTGTRRGMTDAQIAALRSLLLSSSGEFHHGDCIGADAQAHDVAVALGFEPVIHPPINPAKRAYKCAQSAHVCEPKEYLARNKDIVRSTEMLIAAPAEDTEQQRSGTWSTVRFARKLGRKIWIILPNGHLTS
jgi:hypothetical protein